MWIKSTNNLAKIPEKNLQNLGPEVPKSRSGGFWAALGCFLVTRDLPDVSGTPSRRLWGGSWGRFRLILTHLGDVLGAQGGPKFLPRWPKMLLRRVQDSIFSKKVRKNESFELGWYFSPDFCPILFQKYIPDFWKIIKIILEKYAFLAFTLF